MPRSVLSVSAQKHQSPAETPYVHYYFLNHVVLTVRGLYALRKYRRQTVSRRGWQMPAASRVPSAPSSQPQPVPATIILVLHIW